MVETTARWIFVLFIIAIVILIILIVIIPSIISKNKQKLISQKGEFDLQLLRMGGILKDKDLEIEKMLREANTIATGLATKRFEDWKEKELETHRKVIFDAALEQSKAWLSEWKLAEDKGIRKDAITRSMGVNFGKITEHLLPFSAHLEQFDPRDIRFIGSPVDLMIFDGATAKRDTMDIYFVEIKTGTGQLTRKQKTIRDAISFSRVHWLPIFVPEFKWDIPDDNQ